MKKVYIAEKKGIRFYVDKRDEDGKRIPKYNIDGVKIPGEVEQHQCNFDQFESAKRDGERIYKSVFIVTDVTPKEVAEYIENVMIKNAECELEEDHIKRINPKQFEALGLLNKEKEEKEKALSKIEQLEAELEAVKAKKAGRAPLKFEE